ncbi:MAG: hypothetical protein J5955_01065 [Bacilli bacterium]|nr:hypothetical protein [Bacilli bacterium]
MKEKSLKIIAIATASISLVLGGAIFANKTVSSAFFNADANDTHSLVLNSSTSTGLTSEYGNGTFITNTEKGNEVTWSYNYGKASDGNLIELGKNEIGFPAATQFSIGNASPITSINSISVVIGENDTLLVFGSHDNSTFYKLDYLTQATAVNFTGANEYHYVRFANGNQDKVSVTISSISVSYDCVAADYSDELSDVSSETILADGSHVLSYDNTEYIDGLNSRQSLKITGQAGTAQNDFSISLGKSIPSSEIIRHNFEFYCNTLHSENYDSGHSYIRFLVYPGVGSGRNSGKKYIQTENIKCGYDWTRVIVDFSTLTDITAGEKINSLYVRAVYINGYALLDQARIIMNDTYPAISEDLYNTYEANDLSNGEALHGYGTVKSAPSTSVKSIDSLQSGRVTIDADYRMWHYQGGLVDADCTGKSLRFDIKAIPVEGKNHAQISFQYQYDDEGVLHVYTISGILTHDNTGVTRTDLGNGFYRFVINFDAHHNSVDASTKTSTNVGFNLGDSREAYVDNYFVIASN